VCWLLVLRLCW